MLHAAVEYGYLFSKLELSEDDFPVPEELGKVSGFTGTNQEESWTESYTANYLSILLGISFPLGGN